MMRIAAVLMCWLVVACTQTPPTRFYTLAGSPVPPGGDAGSSEGGVVLALAPISLPAYLDRPQIVTRLDATRMQIAEFDSWIEPLDSLIQRTIAMNLQSDDSIRQVIRLPQRRAIRFDKGVEINFSRFETTQDGIAWIDADWLVIDGDESDLVRRTVSSQKVVLPPQGYAERSLALSELVNELSQAINNSLDSL